jgi:hypothetical protein
MKKKNLNEKCIVAGHEVNGKILGHPIFGIPAGKILTKMECFNYYLALAYFNEFDFCYGNVSVEKAFNRDVKKRYFIKV